MVQRKEPIKLKPQTKQVSKPLSFDRHESPISKGTASSTDYTKKKTMKYLPNYMKPTSSSDARKDQLQVTHCNSPSSPPSVTSKRKPITPFLKRNKSKVLFQKLNLNRATCSSTLKDSKFPKALDLNSAGTSIVRVCCYTYCSLNGHVHEPVPPLKSFLASKRKLIKTQQSMKLKGFSPFRKREPKRSEKEVSPLIQEVVNDFIVEIYASSKEKIVDPVKREEEKSDFSVEEMDAMVKLVEYVSCDQEIGANSEKCENSDLAVEEIGEKKNPVGSIFESFKEFDHVDFMDDLDVLSDSEGFSSDFTDGGSHRSNEQIEKLIEEKSEVENGEIQNRMVIGSSEEGDKEDQKSNFMVDLEERGSCTEFEVISERKEERVLEIETSDCSENEIPTQVLENSIREKGGEVDEEEEEENSKIQEVEKPNSNLELEESKNHQEEIEPSDCLENEIGSYLLENVSDQNSNSVVDLDERGNGMEFEAVPEREEEKFSEIETNETPTQVLENSIREKGGEVDEEEEKEDSKIQEVEKPNSILELEESKNHQEKFSEIETSDSSENETPTQVLENSIQEKGGEVDEEEEEDSKIQQVEKPNSILELEEDEKNHQEEIDISETESDHENEEQTDPKRLQDEEVIGTKLEEDGILQAVENPICMETESDHENEEKTYPKRLQEEEEVIGTKLEEDGKLQAVENPTCMQKTELDNENKKTDPKRLQEEEEEVIGTKLEEDGILQAVENPTCMQKTELDNEIKKDEAIITTEASEIDQLCFAFGEMRIEGEDYSFDPKCQQKNRMIIARRRLVNGEDEYMRGFNPRAPRFLTLEPDPDSEKVDLRHQMMDERKNAEEYLIDYALQKAVNQLAPARKKKVELLVAAFEKVVPVPVVPVQGGGVACT